MRERARRSEAADPLLAGLSPGWNINRAKPVQQLEDRAAIPIGARRLAHFMERYLHIRK